MRFFISQGGASIRQADLFPDMGKFSAWSLFLVLSLLAVKALAQDNLDLADALGDDDDTIVTPTPKPKLPPTEEDIGPVDFGPEEAATPAPPAAPQVTKAPIKSKPKPAGDDLDLSDALNPDNDIGGKDKNKEQTGGGFSDSDLADVGKDDTYKPDKGKGGRGGSDQVDNTEDSAGTMAETGTIAGIVSAVALALVGAVSSYISYQKKKFCFAIQQSLNADPVKTENPDAVVATEPQVQQTLLEPANAEPPSEENAV